MKMVRVYDANNTFEAHLVQQHLSQAGIDAQVRGEDIPYPGIPFPGSGGTMLAVWVPEAQHDEARNALDEVFPPEGEEEL